MVNHDQVSAFFPVALSTITALHNTCGINKPDDFGGREGSDPLYIFILHNSIDCSDNTLEVTANDVQPGP